LLRLWRDRHVLELVILALERHVVLRQELAHDADPLFHPRVPRLERDVHGLPLVDDVASAGLVSLADAENRSSLGDEVEARPLVGQQDGMAEREARQAAGADPDALRACRDRRHQRDRFHPRLGQDAVAHPDGVEALGLLRSLR
jgi:hypothetical protein